MATAPPPAPIGEFEQLTLLALLRLEPDAYGAAIRREIETRAGREVQLGALYTTLDRLERKRLVEHWMGEPTPERGGRRKKLYRLTPEGADALSASLRAVRQLAAGVDRRLAARLGAPR
jgi:DNA-binding PadR family transcriptional regulator